MGAKYAKGQKVRIISLRDEHLKAKHPHIEEYVSQTGVIIESHWYGISESYRPNSAHPHVVDHHIYEVRLDKDLKIIGPIPEDALEPVV
jgi:hypothetical protein